MKIFFRLGVPLLLACINSQASTPISIDAYVGVWQGEAHTPTERTRLILDIDTLQESPSARITLLDIGVMGWPATAVENIRGLRMVFPSDSGDQVVQLSLYDTSAGVQVLRGTWSDPQFDNAAELNLERIVEASGVTEQHVDIKGPAGQLSAALVLPTGANGGSYPGVVFLHGAGLQSKDTSRFAAYELARQGIASVIFDKRGVGASQGQLAEASFADLADDGIAVAEYLSSLPIISAVGFFGHSQGGWLGPLAASKWNQSAFVIASAGPAVPPSREAQWEFVRRIRALGEDEAQVDAARHIIDYWHEGVRTNNWGKLQQALKLHSTKNWFDAAGMDFFAAPPDVAFIQSYRRYMDYDPMPTLRKLKPPLMAILAPSDESIDSFETEQILRELIRHGKNIRIKLYPGVDHSMRTLAVNEQQLRWPQHPKDYFSAQADFIYAVVSGDKK